MLVVLNIIYLINHNIKWKQKKQMLKIEHTISTMIS